MADVLTPEQRKKNMSHIKGKDTKPELIIRRKLFASGVRGYRVHYDLPGKPDIVFTKKKVVIFIDGCFWHKCPICFQEPETRKKFWVDKIDKNCERDLINNLVLVEKGWTIIRIWEHHIRKNSDDVLKEIMTFLGRTNITDSSSSGGGGGYKYIRII
ncbi:MAG: very short patch repair endonuclease [Methanomicrobiales archaeon]|jgi:DNA mismatch endonuclease (patch repair protein)|nr:very short patch repair endonuclease [Methanomicrobiales archaeon]